MKRKYDSVKSRLESASENLSHYDVRNVRKREKRRDETIERQRQEIKQLTADLESSQGQLSELEEQISQLEKKFNNCRRKASFWKQRASESLASGKSLEEMKNELILSEPK